jgi:O-acetyl-ADP-ribose deacetylase (regulator of RNase III)
MDRETLRMSAEIQCLRGDIVRQEDIEAIVNAANAELRIGGGVAGAIHRAAGPELAEECAPLAPIRPGQAVITGAPHLPNSHVIHCLGPIYGVDEPSAQLLADCYRNALRLAQENSIDSLAFPALSTGAFGYPMEEAADVALATVVAESREQNCPQRIRFVLFDQDAVDVHRHALARHG